MDEAEVLGVVTTGHGVASGRAGDPRFPDGTLALQWPLFQAGGLDLSGLHRGTINVSVAPLKPRPGQARFTFPKLKWHPECAAEDFSFFDLRLAVGEGGRAVRGFVYWPHPETKPEHFQDAHVVELLAPRLAGVSPGAPVRLWVNPAQMTFAH